MENKQASRSNENRQNLQERFANLDRQMDLLLKEAEILRSILSLDKGAPLAEQAEHYPEPACHRDPVASGCGCEK